jgi:hypothetical protein
MRRRFGRRRQRSDEGRGTPIDEQWLQRAAAILPVETLTRKSWDDLPDSLALVGAGEGPSGAWMAAVSPGCGADAAVAAALAAARHEGESPPRVVALAPSWAEADQRVASRLGVRALALGDPEGEGLAPDPLLVAIAPERIADALSGARGRELFARAHAGLEGLAAKHGGGLRIHESAVQLVLHTKPVASLIAGGETVTLELLVPSRESHVVTAGGVGELLDRLEGNLRRRLNDRKVREGEEGVRGRLLEALVQSAGLRSVRPWPLGGACDGVDAVAVDDAGALVIAIGRGSFGLSAVAESLRAACAIEPLVPALAGAAAPPVRLTAPARLALGGTKIEDAAAVVLRGWGGSIDCYVGSSADGPLRGFDLGRAPAAASLSSPSPSPRPPAASSAVAAPVAAPPEPEATTPETRDAGVAEGASEDRGNERDEGAGASGDGRRRRRRRGRGRGRSEARGNEEGGAEAPPQSQAPAAAAADVGFEEFSLFDLDEEAGAGEGRGRRRRRGRGRGRTSEGGGDDAPEAPAAAGKDESDEKEPRGRDRQRRNKGRGGKGRPKSEPQVDDDDLDEDLLELSPDAPDLDATEVPPYEDDDEGDGDGETEMDRVRLERERRRRARLSAAELVVDADAADDEDRQAPEEDEVALPRGRAAILAHADRESITAAIFLAREVRQIEGIWVYPQEDLMTFFRGVATDLRENTPVYVVGFTAKPSRDVLQAAALYRGRLVWFDHQDWPPEDVEAMKGAIGTNLAHLQPGAGSILSVVLPFCTRRSRFSDKLVDLVTGRFTQHDFQRWGRLWWWRLGEIAGQRGDRRNDVEMLLGGRPSDLTKEAAHAKPAPAPQELAFVSERDFRLVHFGGLGMVVAEIPEGLNLHLASRIARERYGAALSLARDVGSDVFVLGADDGLGRRAVDVAGMVAHLDEKFVWAEALPDADHVARLRVQPGPDGVDRLDELVAEIGMGRSILEG